MPKVNHQILEWARVTAGLSSEDAAKKLKLTDSEGRSAMARLEALEAGTTFPSTAMLNKMSKVYRRPLLTFYLSGPPTKASRGHDFRLLPQRQTVDEPLVDVLIRGIRARQSMVRSIIEDDEDAKPLKFVGSVGDTSSIDQLAASLKDVFAIDMATYRRQTTKEAGFDYLRSKAESAGVFVLLIGNLGNYRTSLAVEAFRGFALADDLAPFVVINDQDAKSAWSFTLLHELAHILLGETGISGTRSDSRVEILCNDAASVLLVPQEEVDELGAAFGNDFDAHVTNITKFSRPRLVSRSMVAYRLFKVGSLTEAQWGQLAEHFRREWYALKEKMKEKQKAKENEGGPNYYVIKRHRIGHALLVFVERNMQSGILTPTKAGKVLGVMPRSVVSLLAPPQQAA
jgi:Zn-dependent peptidase ImmA (M78 family)